MRIQTLVAAYSRALAGLGSALLLVIVIVDRGWTDRWPELLLMLAGSIALRGLAIPLSKYSYLTQTSLVALVGGLLVGVPATALAIAVGILVTDTVWLRKPAYVAWINMGREVIALAAGYGVYAATLRVSGVPAAGLHAAAIPALFFYILVYFVISRALFYFSLLVRNKLEQDEQLLILRYECIGYAATLAAAATIIGPCSPAGQCSRGYSSAQPWARWACS